jgi:hypothetical protein
MALPKKAAPRWQDLYADTTSDKKVIESLQKKIQDLLLKDPSKAKKAAHIVELWLNKSKNKR